jgi:hypothetical protein
MVFAFSLGFRKGEFGRPEKRASRSDIYAFSMASVLSDESEAAVALAF